MSAVADRVTRTITRTRWAVVIVLVAFAGALTAVAAVGEATRTSTSVDALPIGSDSAAALQLRDRLPAAEGSTAVVLFAKESGTLSGAELATLQQRFSSLPDAGRIPLQRSEDGTAAVGVVPVAQSDATGVADVVGELRTAARADLPDGVTAQVTGPAAIQADLAAVFDGANVRLLAATATVVALLLIITYRSPVLWVVPLAVVGVADRLAAVVSTHVLSVLDVTWDESTIGILSVLVFGAGTDYALLLISRYRDELRRHASRHEAMALALRRTAEAVVSSAVTVVLGLLTLMLSLFPATRGLGLACAVGVVIAAAFVLVVLPALLVLFGRWVFWPRIPREGESSLADGHSLWRRVGDRVAAHPRRFIAVTLVALAAMGAGVGFVSVGLSQSDQFLTKPEAISASERLGRSFPAGSADPAVIVTTASADAVKATTESVRGVDSARVTASEGGVSEVDAVLAAGPGTDAAAQTVRDLRAALAVHPGTHVAGTEAQTLDQDDASSRDRGLILPVVLGLVLLALVVLLRSVVAPIVLVATVLATFVASLGASWWIFTQVFGFSGLDNSAPLYAFVFLVALGVDYNIFLVSRAREESARHGAHEGMLRGLAATGGVITSAGILLAAVFAVLGVLPLVVLAQIGVIICVGVLLDTLVVRTVLVPAIALVLGDRFWWPRLVQPGRHEAGTGKA
ncbi:RND superfamily putative drug exporter [Terracoccus luteus]|uniref:RND superfamily putative drug exporter n=1 Tax=Terracoccus luteus TaxID=53356 RepID=A0A495XWR6_9MICO|nr:MMPL family transporter [Terracoccus luteus]RKT79021.1 RND superfamily putative drug exporter [Terracoccus luteus]